MTTKKREIDNVVPLPVKPGPAVRLEYREVLAPGEEGALRIENAENVQVLSATKMGPDVLWRVAVVSPA